CMDAELLFLFSSRRRHTRSKRDWSSDVWSSDLGIFEHSGYYQALMVKAIETITDVVINLQRYSKASDFDIKFIEERFGRDEDTFGAYRLHTSNDHTVH